MTYSTIEDGTLIKFDERDLDENGHYTIPDGVVAIADKAFACAYSLKSIHIPNSVNTILDRAFAYCTSLESITIPDSVTCMSREVFMGCRSLKTVKMSSNIQEMRDRMFDGCYDLTSVNIPEKVTRMGKGVFAHCESLESIDIPEGVEEISDEAFEGCSSLTLIKIPDGVKCIGRKAFENCFSLKNVDIPDSVTSIIHYAFHGCSALKIINIPNSVVRFGEGTFADCITLEAINIPESFKTLREGVFSNCIALKNINLSKDMTKIDSNAFWGCKSLKSIVIPDSVTEIGSMVFGDCESDLKIDFLGRMFTPERLERIAEVFNANPQFVKYALENRKFLPKTRGVIRATNPNEIAKYYQHSEDWRDVLIAYQEMWQDEPIEQASIVNLYQLCLVLGLFQDKFSKQAKEFVLNNIIQISPKDIHMAYDGFDTRNKDFNPDFAKFFMKNYRQSKVVTVEGEEFACPFLSRVVATLNYDEEECFEVAICAAKVFNQWDKVMKAYPNRFVVYGAGETGSVNNTLTEEDVLNAVLLHDYEVREGNEMMVNYIAPYGYSQEYVDTLQDWYEEAKIISSSSMILKCDKDIIMQDEIVFELLSKDNPKAPALGELTNCCQVIGSAGEQCLHYGMVKPNSGFVDFTLNGKTIAQSWVWYNTETQVVCLDNIELPKLIERKMKKDSFYAESLKRCLIRMAESFVSAMEKSGHKVKYVTIGQGWTNSDLLEACDFKAVSVAGKKVLPSDYDTIFTNGEDAYSDATTTQYIIPVLTKRKQVADEGGLTV